MDSEEVEKLLDSADYYRVRSGRIKPGDLYYWMSGKGYGRCKALVGDLVEKTPDYIFFRPLWSEVSDKKCKDGHDTHIVATRLLGIKQWSHKFVMSVKHYFLNVEFPHYLFSPKNRTVEIDLEELAAFKKRIEELEKQGDKNK